MSVDRPPAPSAQARAGESIEQRLGERLSTPNGNANLSQLDGSAGLVLVESRILVDPARGVETDALLIAGGRVAATGGEARLLARQRQPQVARIAFPDGAIVPGWIDAHTHLLHQGLGLTSLDLADARSVSELIERVRAALDVHPPERPLIGENWDDSHWPRTAGLTGLDLMALGTATPIVLRRVCGHKAVANSAALELIGERRPDLILPPHCDRQQGVLLEEGAMALRQVFPPDQSELLTGLDASLELAAARGVTGVHEICTPDRLGVFVARRAARSLPVRIVVYLIGSAAIDNHSEHQDQLEADETLRLGGAKLFLDGSIGAATAALRAPYARPNAGNGLLLMEDDALAGTVRRAHDRGIQLMLHAIGDRAIAQALAALAPLGGAGVRRLRHRIEHLELVPRDLVDAAQATGVSASMQPNFVARWGQPGGLYEAKLGRERWRAMNRFATLLRGGVPIAFGSDCMPMAPVEGFRGAVGHPVPEERLSMVEALACYSLGSATAAGDEHRLGSLEPGKLADFVLLDQPPWDRPAVDDVGVVATVVGGRVVYERGVTPPVAVRLGGDTAAR
jgi:predicted amidohydrolase YtcJ